MSGRPNPDGIVKLREALIAYSNAREAVRSLNEKIGEDTVRRNTRHDEMASLSRDIQDLLMQMDVKSPGNAGWEGRYFELLLMLANEFPL